MIPEESVGFTQIPNELLEQLAKAQMQGLITAKERAVIDFIMRNTFGYHREVATLKTSVIAKELGASPNYITHLLKRLVEKDVIVKSGDSIAFNKDCGSWKEKKLPHRAQKSDSHITNVTALSRDSSVTKNVTAISHNSDSSVTIEPVKEQLKTIPIDPLNKTLNKYINKEKENIKERKIDFNIKTFKFENIPKEKIDNWTAAFPNCNVDLELKKMEAWLAANPEKRKKNYEKFIVNWLGRAKGDTRDGKYIQISGERKFTGFTAKAGEW
ncbi:MAG: replication protein [Caldisericaceae bacterium]